MSNPQPPTSNLQLPTSNLQLLTSNFQPLGYRLWARLTSARCHIADMRFHGSGLSNVICKIVGQTETSFAIVDVSDYNHACF
jgi:hypothetical protein